MRYDFTKGAALPLVIRFSLPMMLGSLVQQLYNVADSYFVGNMLTSNELAVLGSTASVTFFLFSFSSGLASACEVTIAQNYGAGLQDKVRQSISSAVYYAIGCAILLGVLGIVFLKPMLRIMLVPAEIFDITAEYISILIAGSFFQIFYNTAAAVIRALGDSRTPLLVLLISSVVKIVSCSWAVHSGYGLTGLAVTTLLAQLLSGAMCVVFAWLRYDECRLSGKELLPQWGNILQIGKMGIPMGLLSSLLAVGDMAFSRVVNSCNTDVIAAYMVSYRIHELAIMPLFTFATAFGTFVAQNMGAGNAERVRKTHKQASLFIGGVALLSGAAVYVFRKPLILWLYTESDVAAAQVVPKAMEFLGYVPWFYVVLALIWIYNYTVQSCGEVKIPTVSGLIELVVKLIVPQLFCALWGYIGVWYAYPVSWIIGLVPTAIYYHSGRWKSLSLVER